MAEPPGPAVRLDSWKAIAAYLGRHPTTVQRWELHEGLPVHRHLHEKRGSVYAFQAELDAWLAARSVSSADLAGDAEADAVEGAEGDRATGVPSDGATDAGTIAVPSDAGLTPAAAGRLGGWRPWSSPAWHAPAVALLGLATVALLVVSAWALNRTVSLQSELHEALAAAQGPAVEAQPAVYLPTSPEALDAYRKARFFWNRRTREDMRQAIVWYERALEREPTSPLIYTGIADVYATFGPPAMTAVDMTARGTAAAERALALAPNLGEAHAVLGKLYANRWDWDAAEWHFRQATARAPSYAPAHYWYASFLADQDRCDEALREARTVEQLNPVSAPVNMVIASIELRCGLIDRAIERSRMTLQFAPDFGQTYEFLGRAFLRRGDAHAATVVLERGTKLTGGQPRTQAILTHAYALSGRRREAERIAARLAAAHARDKALAPAWSVAIAYSGLGQNDDVLTWLEHAYADREKWLQALGADERFPLVQRSARFQQLLDQLRLPRRSQVVAVGASVSR